LGDLDQFGMPVGEYLLAVLPRIPKQADIRGFRIPSDVEGVAGGTLILNRKTLPELTLPAGQDFLQASDYVAWINNVGSELDPPVVASASNEVHATTDQLNLSGVGGLTINGVTITTSTFENASDLVLAINDAVTNDTSGDITGLAARVADDGGIIIVNDTGEDIRIGSSLAGGRNLLGVANDLYKGTLELSSEGEIRLGFASGAETPSELAKLGIATQVFIDSPVSEDLLVFVNGEGDGMVAGTFDETMKSPDMLSDERIASLRAQRFDVSFTSAHQYQITWTNPHTGDVTVVAARDYDHAAGIAYQGVQLKLDNPPTAGDKFIIDGNQDGTGDNLNMLALVDLEKKGVIGGGGGKTISQAYEEEVGKVGNFSSQAKIAQKALEVVNQQAIEARDKVSGVSLDAEAADLIRFQQAYQAAAKTIQTSGILFDSILQASR
jgi:flagellar hook-associated protein FlgK